MIFTKWFAGSGPRQILCMLLALAVLGTAAAVLASTLTLPSNGEDVSIEEVWKQGFGDGLEDGANSWRGYSLELRLKQHNYNDEQRLTYTDGYNFGYQLAKARWGVSTSQSMWASA